MSVSQKRTPPFAHSRMVQFLAKHLDSVYPGVDQTDIARALGYTQPNIISMFKTGRTRVPLEKIPDLAKVIKVDPVFLMRLALEQYWPGKLSVLACMFANLVSDNERDLVNMCRDALGDVDYRFPKEALDEIKGVLQRSVADEERAGRVWP